MNPSRVNFNSPKTFIEPAAFIVMALLAGRTRLVKYFPGATNGGLYLTSGIAAAGCLAHDYKYDKKNLSLSRKAIAIALASIISGGISKVLKGRVALSFTNNLKIIGMGSSMVVIKHLTHSTPPPRRGDVPPPPQIIDQVKAVLTGVVDHPSALTALNQLNRQGFFADKDHNKSKDVFKAALETFGSNVDFVSANDWVYKERIEALDQTIFQWSVTNGVQNDIPKASQDDTRIHLFSVASQYNGAEAPSPFTPGVGEAMSRSVGDYTQGPLAQRTNPVMFEFVTAFLTNLGFNMMENVLPSAGKTYQTSSPIEHGYLRPSNVNIEQLANEMEQNFTDIEVPCYQSKLSEDSELVYLMLGAAPALGIYSSGLDQDSENCKKLQRFAYMANFSAQFNQVKTLLARYPEKEIVLHMTGTGLGVFGNDEEVFSEVFAKVAYTFQEDLSSQDKARVHVQFESFSGSDAIVTVARALDLGDARDRIE